MPLNNNLQVCLRIFLFLSLVVTPGCTRPSPVQPGYVIFIGDSLTSPYGEVGIGETYPDILSSMWNREVVNISMPGLRGVDAFEWVEERRKEAEREKGPPSAVFVALGANDQLSGVEAEAAGSSLRRLIDAIQKDADRVFILKCLVPLRSRGYDTMYKNAASGTGASLSGDIVAAYFHSDGGRGGDGIHPSPKGHRAIAERIDADFGQFFYTTASDKN
jgi:lysophospholipase L1-like esterase